MNYSKNLFLGLGIFFLSFLVFSSLLKAGGNQWELLILDGAPPVKDLASLAVGDVEGDGHVEIITGGGGALLWYRPDTYEHGIIAKGEFHVGAAIEDLDGDGLQELVVGEKNPETSDWMVTLYDPKKDLNKSWSRSIVDPRCLAGPHDLLFVDLDKDGEKELIANATYGAIWGVFAYKRNGDMTKEWKKHKIQTGYAEEGLAAADLTGDGRIEIVSGPDLYVSLPEGPFSGSWKRLVYAPNFREMSRVALVDITGNGRKDIVITESEYPDGISSWFENRTVENPDRPWVEHRLFHDLNFAHSLGAWRDKDSGGVRIFIAEMMKGGWDAPYNFDARLLEFTTGDNGKNWQKELLYKGAGTHQATQFDIDGDGKYEIVGKEWGKAHTIPKVQIWNKRETPSPLTQFRHRLLDRDKAYTGTDILATDIDGDGKVDVVCGAWWYKNDTWERYTIPGIYQVHLAYDLDGDGRHEYIATKEFSTESTNWYHKLSGDLCWLKPIDPINGKWEEYIFGQGCGGWPHGVGIGPVLPGGKPAFFATYHGGGSPLFTLDSSFEDILDKKSISTSLKQEFRKNEFSLSSNVTVENPRSNRWTITDKQNEYLYYITLQGEKLEVRGGYPEIFEIPENPKETPWPKRVLATIAYGEEFVNYDLNHDGNLDILAGPFWLENQGDGTFKSHRLISEDTNFQAARLRVTDVNGDGNPDVVVVEEAVSYQVQEAFYARVVWFENPGDPKSYPWNMHIIDKIRSPHSLDVADLDGDGEIELVVGEHDPFKAYRSRSRLFAYKKAEPKGRAWYRHLIDDRFEHHCGTKIFKVSPDRYGIISHGWKDSRYVHLWEAYDMHELTRKK